MRTFKDVEEITVRTQVVHIVLTPKEVAILVSVARWQSTSPMWDDDSKELLRKLADL